MASTIMFPILAGEIFDFFFFFNFLPKKTTTLLLYINQGGFYYRDIISKESGITFCSAS
jgi:hypothetical protein